MNYTRMVSKYEQQTTVTNEQIAESKTRISGAEEITRIVEVRMKEIATLLTRATITAEEKSKLTKEETENKAKIEAQKNIVNQETKNMVGYDSTIITLSTTIKSFKNHIKEVKVVIKSLEKKVSETKQALKSK